MAYSLQEIEQKLSAIPGEVFQELMDALLSEVEEEYSHLVSTGRQSGKQKTVKGTPDTVIRLPNGKLLLIESTTNEGIKKQSEFRKKLIGDVQKCLSKYSPAEVERIILCSNEKVSAELEGELNKFTRPHGIKLDIWARDRIALALNSRQRHLAQLYLGIPFGTGQVVSEQEFVERYERPGYQTTLSNAFFARENELKALSESLLNSPISLVIGKAGVGKTKLCLEALHRFQVANPTWGCFCVTKTPTAESIFNDIRHLLDPKKDYLIFLDDVNRQLTNFNEVLARMIDNGHGKIHVLATVRDYGRKEVETYCQNSELGFQVSNVTPLPEETILEILKSSDFNIQNQDYHRRILRIAQGNARIAIMLADLAIKTQNLEALNDVSDVYDQYFQRIQSDNGVLHQTEARKVLGFIAFFQQVQTQPKAEYQAMLSHFGLLEETFWHYADQLDELELVEISTDRHFVRNADQSMGGYMFYKVFIAEQLLSFKALLQHYFHSHSRKVQEMIVAANNDFGPAKVAEQVTPLLSDLWLDLRHSDEKEVLSFLSVFWFWLPDQCLAFLQERIIALPLVKNPDYQTDLPTDNLRHENDPYIETLQYFLHSQSYREQYFRAALSAGFHYVSRRPEAMPEWIKMLQEQLVFTREDYRHNFKRQVAFLNWMLANVEKTEYRVAMFVLASFLLKTDFQVHTSGTMKHQIAFYHFPLPITDEIRLFREQIWRFLSDHFQQYPTECFQVLKAYSLNGDFHPVREVLESDLPFVVELLQDFLSPNNFSHCYYLHSLPERLQLFSVDTAILKALQKRFDCLQFQYFRVLDLNRLRNRDRYDLKETRHEEFERLKKEEIITFFQFADLEAFQSFYGEFVFLTNTEESRNANLNWGLDMILENHLEHNENLTFSFLRHILVKGNPSLYAPSALLISFIKTNAALAKRFWRAIEKIPFKGKTMWLMRFYEWLPPEFVNQEYYESMMAFYRNLDEPAIWHSEHLERYISFNPNVFRDFLALNVAKNEIGQQARLWFDFFQKNIRHFRLEDTFLVQKAYFQQVALDQHFDHDFKDWLAVLKFDNNFLFEYIRQYNWSDRLHQANDHRKLGILWSLGNAEEIVEKAMLAVDWQGEPWVIPFEYPANELFLGIPAEQMERAAQFWQNFIEKHHTDLALMQLAFNIIRRLFDQHYQTLFLKFIALNPNVEFFQKIRWGDEVQMRVYSGKVSSSDRGVVRWERVMEMLEKVPDPFLIIQHKAFAREQILETQRFAERVRETWRDDDF